MVAWAVRRRAGRAIDRLRRDRRGVYMLEFAIVANALILFLAVALEFAMQMLVSTALDHGAREASRGASLGPVGNLQTSNSMLTRVLTLSGLPLASWARTPPVLTAQLFASYAALAGAPSLPADGSCPGSAAWTDTVGGSGGIVRYCVQFNARAFLPLGSLVPALYRHRAFFVIKNEPY
ncbi:MAG TPA: TadE/TadG family type IV pilus assembly protein [Roseomonas sp.]